MSITSLEQVVFSVSFNSADVAVALLHAGKQGLARDANSLFGDPSVPLRLLVTKRPTVNSIITTIGV